MFSMNKILFPVDFSDRCDGASHYVEVLARQFDAEVAITHVLPPPRYEFTAMEMGGFAVSEWYEAEKQAVCKKLHAYKKDEWAHLKVSRQLLEGAPQKMLLEYAHQYGADLIVLPTHGYGQFHRLVLGSVTAHVLNHAECPVLTGVHMEEAPVVSDVRFRRIVVALDLNPNNRRALEWALEFGEKEAANLSIVHVTPPAEGQMTEFYDPTWHEKIAQEAAERLEALQASLGTRIHMTIEPGHVPEVVAKEAKLQNADLVIIGRALRDTMLGRLRNNAYAIIRQSPCPVISV